MPIDFRWYLSQLLRQPLVRLFQPIDGGGKAKHILENRSASALVQVISPRSKVMAGFLQKAERCYGCRCLVQKDDSAGLCSTCEGEREELIEVMLPYQHCFARGHPHHVVGPPLDTPSSVYVSTTRR